MVKASALIIQLAALIVVHGDREVLASVDGDTFPLPDNYNLFNVGWAEGQADNEAPFALELGDLVQ